jgi:transcriptional regulator with XRE-family HTH domain
MLSKIERGLLFPTLPTLLRIALVFNTGLEHFFSNEEAGPQIAVVRKNQRLKFPNPPGGKPSDLGERDRQLESGQSSSSAGSSGAAITDEYEH